MRFETTLNALTNSQKPTAESMIQALIYDLGDGIGEDWLEDSPDEWMDDFVSASEEKIIQSMSHLSWFEQANFSLLHTLAREGARGTVFGTDYDVVWLSIQLNSSDTLRIPHASLIQVRAACVDILIGEKTRQRARLRDDLVLFVTIEGPKYDLPDLAVVGPAARGGNSEENAPGVKVLYLPLHRVAKAHKYRDRILDNLKLLSPLSNHNDKDWREAFEHAFDTLEKVRNHFRSKMRAALLELMSLLEETMQVKAQTPRELRALKEAATLLVFRLMFLLEVERRGLLYSSVSSKLALTELMHNCSISSDSLVEPGSIVDRVRHLTMAVRGDVADSLVAIRGASIFRNPPNEAFDELILQWLEPIDTIDFGTLDTDILKRWDRALTQAGAIATGQLEAEVHLSNTQMGSGGVAHTHRVLGDVYEQILALIPKRNKKDEIQLVVGGDKKDERSALGAHYTPPELVEEIVRPALGHLFQQRWASSNKDPDAYKKALSNLRILDPAMGSAHFLTVAALEIAREMAWVELHKEPRPFSWHEPMLHPNPIGQNPEGFDPNKRDDESSFALLVEPVYGGQGEESRFIELVQLYITEVVQACVYGVDVNPLACELGKLSLWLFTLTVQKDQKPELTFLDGNIKCGNSLVGVDFDEALSILEERMGLKFPQGTMDLFSAAGGSIQNTWAHIGGYQEMMRLPADKLRERAVRFPEVVGNEDPKLINITELRRRFFDACQPFFNRLTWLYDLATLAFFYKAKARGKNGCRNLVEVLNFYGANLTNKAFDCGDTIWKQLVKSPLDSEKISVVALRNAIKEAAIHLPAKDVAHPALHWELAFSSVFPVKSGENHQVGFDAIVANPPFVGDRKLRGKIEVQMLDFLKDRYCNGNVVDLCGFFLRRFDYLTNPKGVISTLGPNTLVQAKNRREAIHPLVSPTSDGQNTPFQITRARKSEEWPGEANVYICVCLFVRNKNQSANWLFDGQQSLVLKEGERLSSYLDTYPESEFKQLPSMIKGVCYQGHLMRGEFFLHVRKHHTLLEALHEIPKVEQSSLFAYLNNREVQQQIRPIPSRISIDFYDALADASLADSEPATQLSWLQENRPTLLAQLQTKSPEGEKSVKEFRESLPDNKKNAPHREFWWLYAYPRIELKKRMRDLSRSLIFGANSKVWVPTWLPIFDEITGLPFGPSHKINVVPHEQNAIIASFSSFLFEMHMRRESSTIKGDVQASPTDSIPVFPMPWKSRWDVEEGRPFITNVPPKTEKSLGDVVDRLLAHRQAILDAPSEHGVSDNEVTGRWGPTELYNLYDDPKHHESSIKALRKLHEELLTQVLEAYGWGDLAPDISWGFERPWIDRTTRYVPDINTRRALFDRLAALNHERYSYEIDLYIPPIVDLFEPEEELSFNAIKDKAKDAGIVISEDDLVEVLRRASHGNRKKCRLDRISNRRSPRWRRA